MIVLTMIIIIMMIRVIKISMIIMLVTMILIIITVLGSIVFHTQNLREKKKIQANILLLLLCGLRLV